jgi:hypothetical protein
MESGTSPGIVTVGGGAQWEVCFEANNTDLYTYASFAPSWNTSQGMSTSAGPSNAAPV